MNKSREAFEELFKSKLGAHNCQFDLDGDGNYEERETFCAWFMVQEQQKRIDAALEIISCLTDEYTKSELEKALRGGQ